MKLDRANRALLNRRHEIIKRIKNRDATLGAALDEIRLDWYRIRNAASEEGLDTEDTTEVLIYDEIGGLCGVPADEFVNALNEITSPKIDVRINSPGGSLFDSIAIYNALVKHPAYVTCYVDALAASGASIIAMSGDQCVMMVGSQLMIHDALGMEMGNARDMREMADFLDRQSENIASIYADKAGGTAEDWCAMMLAETWMFAQEAVDLGLADAVYTRPEPSAPDAAKPGMPMPGEGEEPDQDEPEKPGESEPDDVSDELVDALMYRRHNIANRGYKYSGRLRAPNPANSAWFTDHELSDLWRN